MTNKASDTISRRTRVFLDELPWDLRSKNTDWRYVRFDLPKISQFEPSLDLIQQTSPLVTLLGNIKVVRAAFGRRIGLPISRLRELTSHLSSNDLARSRAQVIFSHRAFPTNAGKMPVVWQNCVLDPAMQLAYGANARDISDEIRTKESLYRQAAAVQVSTRGEAVRLANTFPHIADRFVGIPFFTPHVRACELRQIERQRQAKSVRLLFAGNQVWRKGLDLLLSAFLNLPQHVRDRTELTIISNFVGPAVELPKHPCITVLRGVSSGRVMQEMARSHIFINVARFESYGLVFHEAMSQGLVCLAPHWEVQRELFDDGRAGRLLPCSAKAIQEALEELIGDDERRYKLGVAAWQRFQEHYAPAVVARGYAELFRHVAHQGNAAP